MEILFNITSNFEKDLKKFSAKDQSIIQKKINDFAQAFLNDPSLLNRYSIQHLWRVRLHSGLTPSIYVLRIGRDFRLFATFDQDPLFDQIIVTLLRITRRSDLPNVMRGIQESFYQKDLASNKNEDGQYDAN